MVNLLLFVPSPRDIPQVLDEHPLLPCDIFVVKYKSEWPAYFDGREFFLTHKEYTHLAFACDDVVIKPQHIRRIVRDLELFDYEVLSGMMNVEQDDLETVNITPKHNVPSPRHEERFYEWYKKADLAGKGIIEAGFSGFPLMVLRRKVVEQIPFDTDGGFNGSDNHSGGSLDVMFCKACHDNNIPIMVDTNVILLHMRRAGISRVGGLNPDWYFRPKGSPDVYKDVRRKKDLLRHKLAEFLKNGGLHNQLANELLESIANVNLE